MNWFELGVTAVAIAVGVAFGIHKLLKGKKMTTLLTENE